MWTGQAKLLFPQTRCSSAVLSPSWVGLPSLPRCLLWVQSLVASPPSICCQSPHYRQVTGGSILHSTEVCFWVLLSPSWHTKQAKGQMLVVKFKMGISKAALVSWKALSRSFLSLPPPPLPPHLITKEKNDFFVPLGQTFFFFNLARPAPYKRLIFTAGRRHFNSFLFADPCSSRPLSTSPSPGTR